MLRTFIAILAVGGCAALPIGAVTGPNGDTVKLEPVGGSNAGGTADLMQEADGTRIASGTCASLGPGPAYNLEPLAGGKSTTFLQGVALNTLDGRMSGQTPDAHYAVVVERSSSDPTPVACGEIRPG